MNSTQTSTLLRPAYASIARPYALAAFEYAHAKDDLIGWERCLDTASQIVLEPAVSAVLTNPEINMDTWLGFFKEIMGHLFTPDRKHFLSLLIHNKRLAVLPEITTLFNHYAAAFKKNIQVQIITALPLAADMQQAFTEALTKRTGKKVHLECEIDPAVIGGAIIKINDKVIDASVRNKLNRLLAFSLR